MKRPVALVLVLALFVVGVGVGVLGTHLYHGKQLHRPGGRETRGAEHYVLRLERDLELTAEQRRRIDEIVEESRVEGDALHHEMLPRVREHMRRTRERIREVLTPEQQLRFDKLNRENRRRAEHFFLGHGRGRRGPGPQQPERPPEE